MRYDNPELIDRLASAYVLGTLRGSARRRFLQLARESNDIQRAIWAWERRLSPLSDRVTPRQPPRQSWQGIETRLGFRPEGRRNGWLWPGLTAVMGLALLALVIIRIDPPSQPGLLTQAERLALIQDNEQAPLWVVTIDEESGRLLTKAVNVPAREVDRVFELWMLPAQGAPRSFGLLPTATDGRGERSLSPALLALLADAQGLAVSLEPAGGSPTGAPTGPVLYTAPVIGL